MLDAWKDLGERSPVGAAGRAALLLAGLVLVGCGAPEPARAPEREPVAAAPGGQAMPGSRGGWLSDVHERIAAGEYRVRPEGRGLGAANRSQRLRARWQGDGVSITSLAAAAGDAPAVGVRSVAFGRGGNVRSLGGAGFRIGGCREDGATDEKGECLRRVERDAGGVVEWWANRADGLEQGFLVSRAPRTGAGSGRGWLRIDVQVTGARTVPGADASRIVLAARDGRRFQYAGLSAWDAARRPLPTRMRPSRPGIRLEIDDAGARYPISIDPVLTAIDWTTQSDQVDSGSGMFVAGAGDVNGDDNDDVLVAFPSYNGAGADEGRVFLYLGSGLGPEETPAWSSQGTSAGGTPAASAGSRFGASVATAGDVDGDGLADLIIGQSHWSNGQAAEGRAYVFHGSAGGLAATPDWVVEGNVDNGLLGAVSSAGDIDGNGFDDVIVGAPATSGAGRILVFLGSAGGLSTTPSDTISGPAGHGFGSVVASAGDVNGDGRDDVVVGANTASNPEVNEGAAYAYLGRADGTLIRSGAFLGGTDDSFETDEAGALVSSVAGVGDVNGDGYADVAVGSPNKNNGGAASDVDEGAVYLFKGSAAGLAGTPVIIESNQAGAGFGAAVAGPGDVNGDGYADIAVGAPGWDKGPIADAGAVFLIPGSASGVATTNASLADTVLQGALAGDNLGSSVGAAGDVNADGYADLIAGAAGVDDGQSNEGRALFYQGSANTNGLRRGSDLAIESETASAGLGLALAGAGDVNGDGFADVALAAPNFGGANSGRVFVYLGAAGGPDSTVDGTLVGPAGAGFGKALARAGDVNGDGFGDLVVGAPNFGDGQAEEGRLFLFAGSAGGITAATVPVTFDSNAAGALLGSSVGASDVNGDGLHDVLAGAPGLANGQAGEGGFYLLRGSPAGLVTGDPLVVESNVPNAALGTSVAGAGDVNGDGLGDVVAGAPGYTGDSAGQGRIYIYNGQAGGGLGAPITRDGEEAGGALGASVDTAGDADFDGFSDVAAGAPGANGNSGIVYVYESVAGSIVEVPFSYASSFPNGRIGASIAGGIDLDQDANADVVAGAPGFSNGEAGEGAVFVFLSGGTILPGAVSQITEGGVAGLQLGSAVAAAGDVNGDGVGDVLVGAPGYTNGQTGEGRALLYLGNTNGRPYRLRAFRPGSSTIVQPGNVVPASLTAFDISILASGPLGITNVKLETEVQPLGESFDDDETVIDGAFTSTGLAGVTLTRRVTGLTGSTGHHFRARLEFDPAQRILRGRRTPWIYGSQMEAMGVHLRTDGVGGGTACTTSAQCGAAPCVDGVCCNSPCGGGVTTDCLACTMAAGGTMPDGICSPRAVGAGCNDNSVCTTADSCQASGVCQGTATVTCSASDQCHEVGTCDPSTGVCSNPAKADGTTCSDNDMCTTTDRCMAGACLAGPARDCNDSNACTTDSCQSASGCVNMAMAGCTPPDPGPDAGVADGAADGPVADAETPSPDGTRPDDGLAPADAGVDRAEAGMGVDAPRDAARDSIAIPRAQGGGGCDCNVGAHRRGEPLHGLAVLIGLALVLTRRRRLQDPSPPQEHQGGHQRDRHQ